MVNKFHILLIISAFLVCAIQAAQPNDIHEKSLVSWERKIDRFYLKRGIRLPSAIHEFEREVVHFKETKKIIADEESRSKYLDLLSERLLRNKENDREYKKFLGFFYCRLEGINYTKLLSDSKAHYIDINQVVVDVIIRGGVYSGKTQNFRKPVEGRKIIVND